MTNTTNPQLKPVLFIPHGGGPMPLLNDKDHLKLIRFLREISTTIDKPSAILLISAHWEENQATVTSGLSPALIFDYFGFPEQAYNIDYDAKGDPMLANKVVHLLRNSGVDAMFDQHRGFDHGMFVPLKLMYPNADVPCVQLSLMKGLDPQTHISIGNALAELRKDNVLIIGSGFSFHNLQQLTAQDAAIGDSKNETFEDWLIDTCTNATFTEQQRTQTLIDWRDAPYAEYCHPREEHLLPLFVCYGAASSPAKLVFNDKVLGKRTSGYIWKK